MSEQNTPGVQGMLGAAGAPPQIRFNGKVLKLGSPTQAAKARLEELAADAAVQRVEAMQGRMKPATYDKMLSRICDRITAGDYKTWRAGWHEVVWADGGTLFSLSLFHEFHPEMTVADVETVASACGRQYAAALARVLPPFLELILSGREDVTPEQADQVRTEVANLVARLEAVATPPTPIPPESPIPENTAT